MLLPRDRSRGFDPFAHSHLLAVECLLCVCLRGQHNKPSWPLWSQLCDSQETQPVNTAVTDSCNDTTFQD